MIIKKISLFMLLFSLHSSTIDAHTNKIIKYNGYLGKKPNLLADLARNLNKYGLIFSRENPDILFCDETTYTNVKDNNKPIIFLDSTDQASLGTIAREALIDNQNVKAVFKSYILTPCELNNDLIVDPQYYHFKLINDYAQSFTVLQPMELSPEKLSKIYQSHWFLAITPFCDKMRSVKNYTIDYYHERPIDVAYMATVESGSDSAYTWHRKQAIAQLEKISSDENIKLFVSKGDVIKHDKYLDILKQSKIVVSPWGWGEWCWRDFESMYCGAIVIKPDTSFISTYPDIYLNNITYVACKPDFSDLEEKIRYVLDHYDSFVYMRSMAKSILARAWDMDYIAQQFVINVHSALAQ